MAEGDSGEVLVLIDFNSRDSDGIAVPVGCDNYPMARFRNASRPKCQKIRSNALSATLTTSRSICGAFGVSAPHMPSATYTR